MAISMRIKHCGAIAARGSEGVNVVESFITLTCVENHGDYIGNIGYHATI